MLLSRMYLLLMQSHFYHHCRHDCSTSGLVSKKQLNMQYIDCGPDQFNQISRVTAFAIRYEEEETWHSI